MLRLVDRTPSTGERIVALGESMLDREQRGGVLMTIDLFPVRAVAETHVDVTARRCWAGRLRTKSVTCCWAAQSIPRLGLMRALWSHEELRGLKPAHWGFSAREAAQMRRDTAESCPALRTDPLAPVLAYTPRL